MAVPRETGTEASLSSAFDALARAPMRGIGRWPYLPFAITALIALLLAALIAVLVVEDRRFQRDALVRDIDSAAQQLGARMMLLHEAITTVAVEMNAGALGDAQVAAAAQELLATRAELLGVARHDAAGSVVASVSHGNEVALDPTLAAEVATLARQASSARAAFHMLSLSNPGIAALVVPLAGGGAIIATIALRDLLVHGLPPELLQRYRLALVHDGDLLAATSASFNVDRDYAYATTLAPLPPNLQLQARAFRRASPFPTGALIWIAGVLALAVAVSLTVLARYTQRLQRIDRALLAETTLRRAMENSQATGMLVLDPRGAVRYVNRAFSQMTGWSAEQIVAQQPPLPFWPADDHAHHQALLQKILAGDVPASGAEARVLTSTGATLDVRIYVSALVDGGRQIGWMASITDVTEPGRIRTELAATQERLVRVLESVDAAVSVIAVAGPGDRPEQLFGNLAYREIFGVGAEGHDRLTRALPSAEHREVFDETSSRWFDVRTREIRWPAHEGDISGQPARLLIATDITLRKTADDIARQQQEKVQFTARLMTMGEMASSLAHELNQPLTAISNYSEGMLARLSDGRLPAQDLRSALERTTAQAQRAGGIVRRIREFVKRSEPRRRPTEAARIIEDTLAFARIEADKRRIQIAADLDPDLPPLDVDPILIEQLLLNLLKNAIEAMDQSALPRIDVRVRRNDATTAEFAVVDRGTGIAPEHLESLFEPFFSTKTEGMGMGMNICRSIVEFHHGQLIVEPNDEGIGGTVMRFTLPLAVPAADREADAAESSPATTEHLT